MYFGTWSNLFIFCCQSKPELCHGSRQKQEQPQPDAGAGRDFHQEQSSKRRDAALWRCPVKMTFLHKTPCHFKSQPGLFPSGSACLNTAITSSGWYMMSCLPKYSTVHDIFYTAVNSSKVRPWFHINWMYLKADNSKMSEHKVEKSSVQRDHGTEKKNHFI